MAHRRALEGLRRQPVGREAERLHIGRNVGDPERPLEVAEVLEEPRAGPFARRRCSSRGEASRSTPSDTLRQAPALEVTRRESWGAPASSMVAMAANRAPVSARALSTTSLSTVSRSRLALMRRLAALSAEMRARSASFSAAVGSRSVIPSSLHPPRPRCRPADCRRTRKGPAPSVRPIPDGSRKSKNS